MSERDGRIERIALVSPVFNDWLCADELVTRVAALTPELPAIIVVLVDDGSVDPMQLNPSRWQGNLESVEVLHAGANLGHQRAISLGLAYVMETHEPNAVVVIDADGEDDPAGIVTLLSHLEAPTEEPARIVVAQRAGRKEDLRFRAFYRAYKGVFRVLTGRRLDFGNFSALSGDAANRLLYLPELWNHYPATVMRSRISLQKVPLKRSKRFHGSSRMNFVSLVNHGLSAVAVFSDVVFARLLMAVSLVSGVLVTSGIAVMIVRIFTTTAIPGWATAAMGFVFLALIQVFALLALMTFIQLASRSQIPATPRDAAPAYIRSVVRVYP